MIICNSQKGCGDRCVACMDGLQSLGGTIGCDIAENLDFKHDDILKQCPYAQPTNIHDAATRELFS